MTALQQPDALSVRDYLAGEEASEIKHEYLGGAVHAMAGASIRHNNLAGNCFAFLHGKLRGKSCRPYNGDNKIRIEFPDHTRFYYPDAMVACQTNPETDHYQTQPIVVVEVPSPSTRRTDLGEKRDAYLAIPSLKVLLLVEADVPSVMVYRRAMEGGFTIEQHTGLESEIPLPEIETCLTLAELYDYINFAE